MKRTVENHYGVRLPPVGGYRRSRSQASRNRRSGGFLGIESKFYDTSLTAAALTAPTNCAGMEHDPSATVMISTPAQGDSEVQRDGKRIVITSVQITGTANIPGSINQTVAHTTPLIFIALVLDTQTNGALLDSEDVFLNPSGLAGNSVSPLRNLVNNPRFRVLKKWSISHDNNTHVHDGTNIEVGGLLSTFNCYLKLDLPVNFNAGTTASIANVVDNSLHILACASSVGLAPTITYNARIRFQG